MQHREGGCFFWVIVEKFFKYHGRFLEEFQISGIR